MWTGGHSGGEARSSQGDGMAAWVHVGADEKELRNLNLNLDYKCK